MAWPANYRIAVFDEISSTMDEARRRANAGEREPIWIMAHVQTAGRGRRGRQWVSPRGNLMATLLFAPRIDAPGAACLSFVAGLAVTDLIDGAARKRITELKWPNDVLIAGAKVSGLLVESSSAANGLVEWVAIGIGVNLAHAPTATPYPATSLLDHAIVLAPEDALARLALAFEMRLLGWEAEGFASIRKEWLARAALIGRKVTVNLPEERFEAIAEDLDASGALIVRTQEGLTRMVTAGDVFPVN